jgi:hypothetical protein
MNTKQKQEILFKSALINLLSDFELTNENRTAEQITELKVYKQYLRDIEANEYILISPPSWFKTSKVYDLLTTLYKDKYL